MIICGVDIETSGLTVTLARILEIACILWDTEHNQAYSFYSTLVYSSDYPPPTSEALAVNGLKMEMLKKYGITPRLAMKEAMGFFDKADCIMGHNSSSFDKPFIDFECRQQGVLKRDKPWIDTRIDLDYPPGTTSHRLTHLAIDHGIIPVGSHRALFDVYLMLQIASKYDLNAALERSKSPLIRVEAILEYKDRQKAKNLRYNWDPTKMVWWKNLRELDFAKESSNVDFLIKKVGIDGTTETEKT